MEPRIFLRSSLQLALTLGSPLLAAGCAADLSYTPASTILPGGANGTALGLQTQASAALIGARMSFRSQDFYSLFHPQPTSRCAGDANTYFDPLALNSSGTPQVLAANLLESTTTIRPSFISNVSVDVTDANLYLATNLAFSCSYGQNSLVPPASSCATFDSVGDTFVTIATAADQTLLIGGASAQNPYFLSSGNQIVRVSALFNPSSVILPPAVLNLGQTVFIEKTDASTHAVTVQTTGTDTVLDSVATATTLTTQYGYLSLTATAPTSLLLPYSWALNTPTVNTLAATFTLPALTTDQRYDVDTTLGSVTLTLPDVTAASASGTGGHFCSLRKTDSTSNHLIITPAGTDRIIDQYGQTFQGTTTPYTLTTQEPELVLFPTKSGTTTPATYYWSTQNPAPITPSTPYPIVAGNQIVLVDATNSALTLSLPSATSNPGKTLTIQRLDSVAANTVTLNAVLTETLTDQTSTTTTLTPANPLLSFVSTLTAPSSALYYWLATPGITYRASTGYNTGYYTTFNPACVGAGPIASVDPTVSSRLVGSAYFDLDRTQLGPNENLLLNITFFPLSTPNTLLNGALINTQEAPLIHVHLVKTGHTGDTARSITQPRSLSYASTTQYPQINSDLAILGQPSGQIQQQQIYLPISIDPTIDRIQIQRDSGSIIFIDATLFRMGYPK